MNGRGGCCATISAQTHCLGSWLRLLLSRLDNAKASFALCSLLQKFFVPFIFEDLPASEISAQKAYLTQAAACHIYLGIYGTQYGYEDAERNWLSPASTYLPMTAGLPTQPCCSLPRTRSGSSAPLKCVAHSSTARRWRSPSATIRSSPAPSSR
ncbi:MAG: DUF4062 domain-containing protein [Prevotella sp.]|nr:DUF4062 domain-containing protein [Prevotella sp.]